LYIYQNVYCKHLIICKKWITKPCTIDAIFLFWACEPEDGLIRPKHVVNINTYILQYIYCGCIILYLFRNVCNDGMKMKTRSTKANGMLKYRFKYSVTCRRFCVCVRACVCVCACAYIYVLVCVCMYVCMYACMYVCIV
jgi:hypothetical protein